jgi:hypothetical protein
VTHYTRLINQIVVYLEGTSGLTQLLREIDKVSISSSGQQKMTEHHIARANSFIDAKQYLRALEELHEAHNASFLSTNTSQAASLCLAGCGKMDNAT